MQQMALTVFYCCLFMFTFFQFIQYFEWWIIIFIRKGPKGRSYLFGTCRTVGFY